jgi:shikimate dehydrogenase
VTPRGSTAVAGIVGDPVAHSLSPVLHNAAYGALGLDRVYVAFRVRAGDGAAAVAAMRTLGIAGLSVTMPLKGEAAAAADVLVPEAAALASVNTLTLLPDGRVEGDSTDGAGFLRALAEAGVDPAGAAALVLGAGGAARAVAHALGGAGARVTVAARRSEAARRAADLAPGGATATWDDRGPAVAASDLVVNATPLGMGTTAGESAVGDGAYLHAGQVVCDLVYHPVRTALVVAAERAGARAVDGLGMLVHQAALQVERWTGAAPPVDVMRTAAAKVLESGRPAD